MSWKTAGEGEGREELDDGVVVCGGRGEDARGGDVVEGEGRVDVEDMAGGADGDVGEENDVGRRRREGVLDDAEDGLLLHRGELDRLQRRRLVG